MERISRSLKGRNWRKVITYFLTCCLFLNTSLPAVMAGPTGGIVDTGPTGGGMADILYNQDPFAHTTQVNVHTTRTIINWTSLNTAGGATEVRETLAFSQGGLTGSAVLNRVSGPATQFDGTLSAPGMSIFIINPAGILFGSGSTVNVTQLVASGLNMENGAFHAVLDDPVNNKMEFAGGNGSITNRANITADSVYLIGKKVYNIAGLSVENGLVVMAAGEEVRLYENGSDVSVIVSGPGDSSPDVRNSSIVSASNGKIVLAAGDNFSRAIRNVGILSASGGEVSIQAAKVENNGLISVSSSSGDGGSVNITGTEGVSIGVDGLGVAGNINANAGANGDGGTINIQTDGLFKVGEDSTITATGGSVSGNGGTVEIACGDFEVAGEINASPGNKIYEPGNLEITTPSVTIADGANAGATDTLYEEDIEALSQSGTSLIVKAEEGITVKDISDGEITGQFGNIELHATGDESAVSFDDNTNTIKTTLGDIIIEAGSGGINVGNLTTGKDLTDEKPAPGMIFLTSHNDGDITTGDLIVRDGWGDGDEARKEIDVKSSGNLTVNGDVMVGSLSDILNVADERPAEAAVMLRADYDVTLNGNVEAHAHGSEVDTSTTKATINIIAGNDATITGNLSAEATSSSSGTAEAIITVEAVGDIDFPGSVTAVANDATAESTEPHQDDEETIANGHAQIIIDASAIFLVDDVATTPKSAPIEIDVLSNDTLEGQTIDSSYIDPADGSLTEVKEGELTVRLIYNSPEDLSTLTFDETGKATVTFTYTVENHTATVTVTLTNGLPVAVDDLAATTIDKPVNINVLVNDTDPDMADILTVIEGAITTKNGTLVMNEDGTFTYTPNGGFVGTDSFTYSVTDGFNATSEVEVKITVTEKPLSPVELPWPYIQAAPGLERLELKIEVSGCPALVKWAAEEVGIDERLVQIWVANSLASTGNIQPCNACQGLKNAAKILQDADGSHIAALAQVVNEFASSTVPPTEEQMVAIADAIARNRDEDSYYALADEYLEALTTYVGVLSDAMGFSATESVQLVTDKYVGRLAQDQNVGVAAFMAASLAALGG